MLVEPIGRGSTTLNRLPSLLLRRMTVTMKRKKIRKI